MLRPSDAIGTLSVLRPDRWHLSPAFGLALLSGGSPLVSRLYGLEPHAPSDGAVLADGSGLSTDNRLSARMLVDALRVGGRSFRIGPEFMSAFPIASRDGTLENRTARSTDLVRAKTGLLGDQRVTALSGYLLRPDGDVAVFSILVNGHAGRSKSAMDAVDRFVAELTRR